MSVLGPVVVRDHLAIDEQDSREAQGTIVVFITATLDDVGARPGRDLSADRVFECTAGPLAPVGLLLLDKLEELGTWLWTGNRDCWIEVDISCGVLFHVSSDSFYHWLRQIVHICRVTMNRDPGRSIIVPVYIHD